MDRDSTATPSVSTAAARSAARVSASFRSAGSVSTRELEDAQLDRRVPQHRVDAVKALRPRQVGLGHTLYLPSPETPGRRCADVNAHRSPGSALTVAGSPYRAVALPRMIRSRWSAGNRLIA